MLKRNKIKGRGRPCERRWWGGKGGPEAKPRGARNEQGLARPDKGFGLIEVLVASAVLGIGLIIILQVFFSGLYLGQISKNSSQAINLAQAKIEEVIASPFDEVVSEARQSIDGFFEREVQVENIETDLKQVKVIVYWLQKDKERSETLATLIVKR